LLYLAKSRWQLGDIGHAREWYDQSVQWMDKNASKNEQTLRFRAEAAELLGIQEPPQADEEQKPEKDSPARDGSKPR
jgi:hypothetical protein